RVGQVVALKVVYGRLERRRLRRRRQRRDLVLREDRHELEVRARPLVGIGAVALPPRELLAAGRTRRPDLDRSLAAVDRVAELKPLAKPGDPGRGWPCHRDPQLVGERVAVAVPTGADPA